jgi:hypothetical protein
MDRSDQVHAPASLPPHNNRSIHCTGRSVDTDFLGDKKKNLMILPGFEHLTAHRVARPVALPTAPYSGPANRL